MRRRTWGWPTRWRWCWPTRPFKRRNSSAGRRRAFRLRRRRYIATANKSNSVITAIDAALGDVRSGRTLPVPEHLRDAHYPGARRLGHGEGYQYAHDFPGHFVVQDHLGAEKQYYEPSDQGVENEIQERVG